MIALLGGAALVAGCAADPALQVRAVGASAIATPAGDQAKLGQAALALGNVGIALQHFRQSLRLRPDSIEALSGIARCYEAMGRGDLSRRYYQEALALKPADTGLLGQYAGALARDGAVDEAQAVVAEIALRTKAPAAQWVIEPGPAAVPVAKVTPVAAPAPVVQAAPAAATPTVPVPTTSAPAPTPVMPEQLADVPKAVLPTPVPQAPALALARVAANLAPPIPVPAPRPAVQRPAVEPRGTVRLERLSLGEVALVTGRAPLWVKLAPARPATTMMARNGVTSAAPRMVRLLNAARRQGLAASRAQQLRGAGWRSVMIGNAPRTRVASLILYPAGQRVAARRLAANLRIGAIRQSARADILVLLGRDLG
jgi:Flp pilus assembly protein TadD